MTQGSSLQNWELPNGLGFGELAFRNLLALAQYIFSVLKYQDEQFAPAI